MIRYTIATAQAETDIRTEYGVNVEKSDIEVPNFKKQDEYNWPYLNGKSIDLSQRRYDKRKITLTGWMKAANKQSAIDNLNALRKAFDKESLIRLRVSFIDDSGNVQTGTKGLFFLVYLESLKLNKAKWKRGQQIWPVEIILTEPSPIKRVYKVGGATDSGEITITYTSSSEFNIHWGDGEVDYDCIGSNQVIGHKYNSFQTHYIIITGVIKDISAMLVESHTVEFPVVQIYDEI